MAKSAPITTKLLRCKECGKLLRKGMNKSGYCGHHSKIIKYKSYYRNYNRERTERIKRERLEYCGICGAKINGILRIDIGANVIYGFCTVCFERVRGVKMKYIRKLVYKKVSFLNGK